MKPQRWKLAGGGCAAVFVVLIAGVMVWWQYVCYVPPVSPPQAVMPVPNARDDFLAAIQLLPADSAAQIKNLYGPGGRNDGRLAVRTPQLRRIVADAQPALQRLRVGLGHAFGTPPVLSFDQQFPELAEYRQLARLLAAESELALREGHPDAALRSAMDAVKMGGQVQRGGPVIHGLVGVAVGAIGLRGVENAIDFADADACARTAQQLWILDAHSPGVADALAGERDLGLYSLAQIFRAANRQAARPNFSQLNGGTPSSGDMGAGFYFFVTPRGKILENYRRYMNESIARARKPYHAQGPPPTISLDPLSALLVPVYEEARFSWAKQQALRRVILARLAVRAYTLRNGHPPASLAVLAPTYLPAVPQDPFAPMPLIYRVSQGKATLYSRGPDGDDDGGRDLGSSSKPNSDGDLPSTRRPASR